MENNAGHIQQTQDAGAYVRQAREKQGLSREKLATKLGMSVSWLRKVESGILRKNQQDYPFRPSAQAAATIALTLKLDGADLLKRYGYSDSEVFNVIGSRDRDELHRLVNMLPEDKVKLASGYVYALLDQS